MTVNPRTGRRIGATVDYARATFAGDAIKPLTQRIRVRLEPGRLADPCWILGRGKDYASVGVRGGERLAAHRYAWAASHGREIPAGMVVHHLCFARACVNPGHLALVTFAENSRLGNHEARIFEFPKEKAA